MCSRPYSSIIEKNGGALYQVQHGGVDTVEIRFAIMSSCTRKVILETIVGRQLHSHKDVTLQQCRVN